MITGLLFRDSIISAANNISNSRQAVDALNVFPVPDGDTGTNMSLTIGTASTELKKHGEMNISEASEETTNHCPTDMLLSTNFIRFVDFVFSTYSIGTEVYQWEKLGLYGKISSFRSV